jgi:hypothetical protein
MYLRLIKKPKARNNYSSGLLKPIAFQLYPFTFYSKYSFIRSKKLFSFLPGLGLKLGDDCNFSNSSRSSLLNEPTGRHDGRSLPPVHLCL